MVPGDEHFPVIGFISFCCFYCITLLVGKVLTVWIMKIMPSDTFSVHCTVNNHFDMMPQNF